MRMAYRSYSMGVIGLQYYGHSGSFEDKSDWQLLKDHLTGVATLAAKFSASFGGSDTAYIASLLHDIGKYSNAFQNRLEGSSEKVDHTSAGAQEAVRIYGKTWGILLAYIIVGHHGGIPNWDDTSPSSVCARLEKKGLNDYSDWEHEINLLLKNYIPNAKLKGIKKLRGFQMTNYIRMLYSCLVDADFIDTEKAFGNSESVSRDTSTPLNELLPLLNDKLKFMTESTENSKINKYRRDILIQCIETAEYTQGAFTLTVPTGGGKTLSSMAFAMKHAIKNGMSRIIYVIPYTSIIEQNSLIFKEIFGESNVLEHHSNFEVDDLTDYDDNSMDLRKESIRLATQNWDAPIVVTTNVQFFESFFSNKPSKCRKLHNVSNSVVIFDEAQTIPLNFLKPSVALIGELVLNYKTSVVLCTATQPSLNAYLPKQLTIKEIMKSPDELYQAFKRIQVESMGSSVVKDVNLAELIRGHKQVLCIVNTRNHAYRLYNEVGETEGVYHLSARMCPLHRREVLKEIKIRLSKNEACKVISTQLIEAGVDVDFPIVYRSMTGIDSIAQSAGRCNREGRLEIGKVYVFEPEKHGSPKGYMARAASKARSIFRNYEDDPLALSAVNRYFVDLYETDDEELDKKRILELHEEGAAHIQIPFHEIAKEFQLIENGMKSIVVPYASCNDELEISLLLQDMKYTKHPGNLVRKLQKYTVQVYPYELELLKQSGAIQCVQEMFNVLALPDLYSKSYGLSIIKQKASATDVLLF